jgi:hypothetical protein
MIYGIYLRVPKQACHKVFPQEERQSERRHFALQEKHLFNQLFHFLSWSVYKKAE